MKKQEANDIIKNLLPKIEKLNYKFDYDVTTDRTKNKRGDIWLKNKEKIIGLIEAKTIHANIGDNDWKDAMRQGKEKASLQLLPFYIVTNTKNYTRFYNTSTDNEIKINGKVITDLIKKEIFLKLIEIINEDNDEYLINKKIAHTEMEFKNTLNELSNIFRAQGIEKDNRIDPTVSFVVLKYISELEEEERTIEEGIETWKDFKNTKDMRSKFRSLINNLSMDDEKNKYIYFKELLIIPEDLPIDNYEKIYNLLDKYTFHGGMLFDVFGTIYETFASKKAKQEFGEFYTRRHITSVVANIMFRNIEKISDDFRICDPTCGSGGFLTDAFKKLNVIDLTEKEKRKLKTDVFFGYDSNENSVIRTKLNMFLAGDGHNNIHHIKDSLEFSESLKWKEENFDYILANPPMGKYTGNVDISKFLMTTNKRMEILFIEKIIDALKPNGHACIIVNDGPLENPSHSEFRKKLLQRVDIEAVVSLNKYVFAPYTKEKTYMLFLRKKIIDSNEYGEEKLEIQTNNIFHYILDYDGYAMSDKRYKTKYDDDIPELEEILEKYLNNLNNIKKLEKIDDNIRKENQTKRLNELKEKKFERLVNLREKDGGLEGFKYKQVSINEIISNDYILSSEYYLRSSVYLSVDEWIEEVEKSFNKIKGVLNEI